MLANGKKNNQPTENLLNQIRILVTFAPPPPYPIILFLFNISLSLSSLALSLKLTVATTTSQSGHVTKAIKWVPSQTCFNVCSIAQCKQLANHLAIDCSVACICLGLQKQVKKKKSTHSHPNCDLPPTIFNSNSWHNYLLLHLFHFFSIIHCFLNHRQIK